MNFTKIAYAASLLSVGIGLAVSGYSQSVPTNGLVVYYPFNGNANDASGNGNNGTVDGATLTTDRFGNTNSAYYFNGVSGDILVPETLFSATDAAWTVSVWITLDNGPYSSEQQIYAKSSANGQIGITVLSGQVDFAIKTASQSFYMIGVPLITNSTMHVVGVYQKGQSMSLYINGILRTNIAVPSENLYVSGGGLVSALGSYHLTSGPYDWFRGAIDDFRVYSRALSASEVQQLYAYESLPPQLSLTNGLVVYYPFNGNANDASGNGNNGTVDGATLTTDRFGKANSAYYFNGVSSDILVPETIFGATNAAWTVSVWITLDSGQYSAEQDVFHKSSLNGEMNIEVGNGQIGFGVLTASKASFATYVPLPTNSTMHIVGVYQKGQSLSLYVNGVLLGNVPVSNENLWTSSFPLTSALGSYHYNSGPYNWFRGTIDDFRVYTRALSASDVQQLYAYESPPPQLSFTNGLVVYYPFNGNANDASGNGHNGTVDGATLTTDRFGNANSAYYFNGVSGDILVPETLYGPTNAAWTLSVWISTDSGPYSDLEVIYHKSSLAGESGFTVGPTNQIFFGIKTASQAIINASAPLLTNSVMHLVGVYQRGQSISFYINGVLMNSVPVPNEDLYVSGFPLTSALGSYHYNGGPYDWFHGKIDDFRVYTRALPASEVQQLYVYEAVPQPPSITGQPQSVTVNAHSNASFNVTATGTMPLGYQWSLNGTNISGATASSLTLANVTQQALGTYAVVVNNAFGSVSSSTATLSMYPFLAAPFGGLVTDWGYNATLSVVAWGTGPLKYQWFNNGVAVLSATNQTLNFPSIQFTNAGLYSVVVSSPLGSVTNPPAQVVVNPAGVSLGMYAGITVTGTVGYAYSIQATTDLSKTNSWTTVATLTLMQPVQLWVDISVSAFTNPHRYYRVVPAE